jgi:hypothetical protein
MTNGYGWAQGVRSMRLLQIGMALIVVGLLTACATTGATYGSGVGDAFFDGPPHAAGTRAPADARITHLPVRYQRGAVQPEAFDPAGTAGSAVAALLGELNARLDELRGTAPATRQAQPGTPPDVLFGCERSPDDECQRADNRVQHRLAVGRPSREWAAWADGVAANAGADYLLVITLEVGNYLPRQRNWRGQKEILLGRDHAQDVRWLTALDRPVSVLQLTGALVGRDGRAVRIAAEGLTARTTPLLVGAFGAQALITEEDVEHARTARRDDLPGAPPVWRAALDNLVAELTAPGVTARR